MTLLKSGLRSILIMLTLHQDIKLWTCQKYQVLAIAIKFNIQKKPNSKARVSQRRSLCPSLYSADCNCTLGVSGTKLHTQHKTLENAKIEILIAEKDEAYKQGLCTHSHWYVRRYIIYPIYYLQKSCIACTKAYHRG